MQKSKALEELLNQFHEGKLAHAFLLETNNPEKCYASLIQFLKYINCPNEYSENCSECNLCHLFDIGSLPSLITIEPDGTTIKKEQVIELKQFFQTKPTFSKYNMYIIKNAELLNSSSANTMLKFIEEPEEDIIGFFITNNKENIIDTIRSRCQILLDFYENEQLDTIPKVWQTIAINYIKEVEMVSDEALLYNKDVLMPLIHERKELMYLFQSIFFVYQKLYQNLLNPESLSEELKDMNFILKKGKIHALNRIKLVSQLLDEINYNLNISLVLDRFVLEGGCL